MTSEFVHLHNHSDYSLLDGAQRVEQLVNTIDDLNMDGVALTEHGNMFSTVPFYQKAKKAGINPIANLPGQGVLLFGDKTKLARPSAFDRINVRRLFLVIERAIALAAPQTIFCILKQM